MQLVCTSAAAVLSKRYDGLPGDRFSRGVKTLKASFHCIVASTTFFSSVLLPKLMLSTMYLY